MSHAQPKILLPLAEIQAVEETCVAHPLNPKSEVYIKQLGLEAGLKRTGLSLARIPPGKESFLYHSHHVEEEFVYVLSGRGRAEIDGRMYEVGPGDFMGFPAPGAAHHLINPYDVDLVYLMGGERQPFEIADFPTVGKTMVRHEMDMRMVDTATMKKVSIEDFVKR